jgi:23S rRNA (cytidine1920-2'-O)/16S rRNA (cytidine1409-2'-O)-methyltransferase
MPEKKQRLDRIVVDKGLAHSRKRSQALIMAGKILVNQQPIEKPGTLVSKNDEILCTGKEFPFVSRGGLKLEAALQAFNLDVNGLVCLDVGASTGGFTDCLLQNGARCIFAVDVGYGQLAWKLRQDPRVVVIERTNIRYMPLETIASPVDLTAIDVSFISLKIVVPAVLKFMKDEANIIALIKPQFEVGKGKVNKGGVVNDPVLHNEVITDLKDFFTEIGLICHTIITSPLRGPKGNKEFFIWLKYSHQTK